MKYQIYSYFKLPITMNPLEYGKLIEQINNIYIVKLSTTNMVVIQQYENDNYIKFYRNGKFIFDFKDLKIDNNTFYRIIDNTKFIFVDGTLVRTEISGVNK
jgi:hypothetical protein